MTIYLNRKKVDVNHFPDGTIRLNLLDYSIGEQQYHDATDVLWLYEPNEEMTLYYIVQSIRDVMPNSVINLELPYLPNARMDRIENAGEVFTLKWFAKFINSLEFSRVSITDPHSNVSEAIIDRLVFSDLPLALFHKNVLRDFKPDVLFFPDAGAHKRYSKLWDLAQYPSTFGNKIRDWNTGKITSLTIDNPKLVENKRVLIIDDICSYGGTFVNSVKLLDSSKASNIALAVTHCEDNITKGELLTLQKLEKVYTTDSLLKEKSDKIDFAFKYAPAKG